MKVPGIDARFAALEILESVVRRKRLLDDALDHFQSYNRLMPRDRAFARNLVSTTLRRLGQIDGLIDHCLQSPLAKKSRRSHDILRLGVCQLVFLQTADHAAVSASVELAGQSGQGHTKKLINAILRRLSREHDALIKSQDLARSNVPDWLWFSWRKTYGEETTRKIALAHLNEAKLDLSVKSDPAGWAEKLHGQVLANGTVRLQKSQNVPDMDGFDEGEWWVQDTSARAVVQMLGAIRGKQIIDLCAAPGGKTAYLLNEGARVTAVDRSDNRLKRLQENMARLRFDTEIITADATVWRPADRTDIVLVDAPCSATGTIRKHPEISWLKSQDDVDKLVALQSRLLAAALEMVKPGGQVLFATCSLQAEEGPDHIQRLADGHPRVTVLDQRRWLPSDEPETGGKDGFFACLLQCD